MDVRTSLLVIGAGPYGVAVAAAARAAGIDTQVVGRPMSFWREHMPEGMFLRSGTDWHLDPSGIDTFEAFVEERGLRRAELDPIPISVFLDHAGWFVERKGLEIDERLVARLERGPDAGDRFVARLEGGGEISADRVVLAPGNANFCQRPPWVDQLPEGCATHTCDTVHFEQMAGARVLIVGGRQSAYEWAALLREHGAARVDLVHRHDVPRFERVSWAFVNEHMAATLSQRGWWRSLPATERERIAQTFWEVGRLTLEWWLTPRLTSEAIHRWPRNEVVAAGPAGSGATTVSLSDGERLEFDRVVLATGYKTDLARVPYLEPLLPTLETVEGSPVLDEAFQTSIPGLYVTGFAATRDFGPFFGFTRACPVAATLIVRDLLAG